MRLLAVLDDRSRFREGEAPAEPRWLGRSLALWCKIPRGPFGFVSRVAGAGRTMVFQGRRGQENAAHRRPWKAVVRVLRQSLIGIVLGGSLFGGDNDQGLPPEPPAGARLPGAQSLLVVGSQRQPAVLTGIDAQPEFTFETEGGLLSVAEDDLVRWGNPVEAKGGARVVLTGGSELIAARAWEAPEPVRLDDKSCRIATLRFGVVSVDRSQIEAIYFSPYEQRHAPRRVQSPSDATAGDRDVVLLTNGDRLRGRVGVIGKDGVVVDVPSGPMAIKTESLESVRFGTLSVRPPVPPKRRLLLGLADGSRLVIRRISADSGDPSKRSIELISGAGLPWPGIRDVVYIQPLGGKVQYLSDRAPASYHHIGFLDLSWPYEVDRNVLGTRLCAGGKTYAKGIGVHSAARLVYKLDGLTKRFAADVAIDSAAGKRGSAIFRVFLAKEGAWHESWRSPIVRGGDRPRPVSVGLGAARGLALVVDYADYGDERDLANWFDARLE